MPAGAGRQLRAGDAERGDVNLVVKGVSWVLVTVWLNSQMAALLPLLPWGEGREKGEKTRGLK